MNWLTLIGIETIRDTIIRVCTERGISPLRLSRESGISELAVRRYWKGESDLSGASIDKIAAYLGLEIRERRKQKGKT